MEFGRINYLVKIINFSCVIFLKVFLIIVFLKSGSKSVGYLIDIFIYIRIVQINKILMSQVFIALSQATLKSST